MKEDSLWVGVPGPEGYVASTVEQVLVLYLSKMFKKINFVVILVSFEFDMFFRLIFFVFIRFVV